MFQYSLLFIQDTEYAGYGKQMILYFPCCLLTAHNINLI